MDERLKIAVPFNYDENWIGGVYYIRNLISALKLLPDEHRPRIILVSVGIESYRYIVSETEYPYLYWCNQEQIIDLVGTVEMDIVFPHMLPTLEKRSITWIPDFQDKHLPEYFTADDLEARTVDHLASFGAASIVFSSFSVLRDFRTFYPKTSIKPYVVHFATFNDAAEHADTEFRARHNIPDRYFYAPNQFWIHKNQLVIIEALNILKSRGCRPVVCFSGKDYDPRAPEYTQMIWERVAEYGLEDQVRMLGFLPRSVQLAVVAAADVIVQPSLFEGWSTVVEDAKAAGVYVLASNLDVHREQLSENATFFEPRDPYDLAEHLESLWTNRPQLKKHDYGEDQQRFAVSFMRAVRDTLDDIGRRSVVAVRATDLGRERLEARILGLMTDNNILAGGHPKADDRYGPLKGVRTGAVYSGGPVLAQHLILQGFSSVELDGVWTVAEFATLEGVVPNIDVDRPRLLRICCTAFNPSEQPRWLSAALDRQQIHRREIGPSESFVFDFELPPSNLGYFRVVLTTNSLVSGGPGDTRKLGVFLKSVELVS